MRLIKPLPHAVLDYALAALFFAAPSLLGFPLAEPRDLSYTVGTLYVAASLFTRYPLGIVRLIPFPVHGVLESLMAASWIAAPWAFGFAGQPAARNFFVAAGAGLLLVAALTDYRVAEPAQGAERRRGAKDRRMLPAQVALERRMAVAPRRRRLALA
jgi:hypothetical protein